MKLRLDEYYYILNINYGWEEIEDYMPDDIADKYLEFCESHNSDEDLTEVFPKEITTVIYV